MSKCWNCGIEITLKPEEIKCGNCRKTVNFPCHNCHNWFAISETKLCKTCGFYICPICDICGSDCQKKEWQEELKEILGEIEQSKLNKICELIESIKIGKDRRECQRGVSISYAKSRIKRCFVKLSGFRIKNELDLVKFKERYEKVMDVPLGTFLTINQSREAGSYGQEYRDVFNLAVCRGKLEYKKIKKEHIEYDCWTRCERETCPKFDAKDLIIKKCPRKECKIKVYPLREINCICPECKYKKDTQNNKKGDLRRLVLEISNKDICQLSRGDFKVKEEDHGKRQS